MVPIQEKIINLEKNYYSKKKLKCELHIDQSITVIAKLNLKFN
jgi:hypothetical protein